MKGPADPEHALALSYAPAAERAALAALLSLDHTLGQILRTMRDPLVGQMRLTWWHEALVALDTAPPPAQPVLRALAAEVLPRGGSGAALAEMIDGWEILLDPDPLGHSALESYAAARGGTLFTVAGRILGAPLHDPVAAAGRGWALADLACHSRDAATAERPHALAIALLDAALALRWSRAARPLGALAHGARMDLRRPRGTAPAAGAPGRVARLAWHRLTGR